MAQKANPKKPTEQGQTDADRGTVSRFSYSNVNRKTGKVGTATQTANNTIDNMMVPEGPPRK